MENSLLDCRYFSFSLHPSARGLALQNKAVHLACGWRGGSLDLEPLRWGQLERWPVRKGAVRKALHKEGLDLEP